jgi:2'-5' RNA ligase
VKSGIVIIAELTGDLATRILEIQKQHDPRMAAELPPHITLAGSSGMGPIPMRTSVETLREKLEPVTDATAPIELRFGPPHRFMQTNIVVLPLDPHGPLRDLHERIKTSGIEYEPPRFAFTPHCTLNFYPEISPVRLRQLMSVRVSEPFVVERIQLYRTIDLTRTAKMLELELRGQNRQPAA